MADVGPTAIDRREMVDEAALTRVEGFSAAGPTNGVAGYVVSAVEPTSSRGRRLMRNVGAGIINRGVGFAIGIVMVPLLLRHLGAEQFGLYSTIGSVIAWLQLSRLGLSSGLVNELVACHAQGDHQRARVQLTSLWIGLALIMLAVAAIFAIAFPFIPWERVFPATSPTVAADVPATVILSVVFSLTAILAMPVGTIYMALQEQHRLAVWGVVGTVVGFASFLLAMWMGAGMSGLIAAGGLSTLLVVAVNTWFLFRRDHPTLRPRWDDRSWPAFRSLFKASTSFFIIDVAVLLVFQIDRFLILQLQDAASVTQFELGSKFYLIVFSLYSLVLQPLWPAVGEALSRGDTRWVRTYLRRIAVISTLTMMLMTVGVYFGGQYLLSIWTRQSAVLPSNALMAVLGAYFTVRVFTDCHSVALFAMGKQSGMAISSIAHGVLNLALGLLLGSQFGLVGIAVAALASYVLTAAWWIPLRVWRELRPTVTA